MDKSAKTTKRPTTEDRAFARYKGISMGELIQGIEGAKTKEELLTFFKAAHYILEQIRAKTHDMLQEKMPEQELCDVSFNESLKDKPNGGGYYHAFMVQWATKGKEGKKRRSESLSYQTIEDILNESPSVKPDVSYRERVIQEIIRNHAGGGITRL